MPTKYTESHRRYYLANREAVAARARAYYAATTEARLTKCAAYRETHREQRRLCDRLRYWRNKVEANPLLLEGVAIPEDVRAVLAPLAPPAPDTPGEATPATPV